jgi:ferrous-iron efflux pump FieF
MELDPQMTVAEAHVVTEAVEAELAEVMRGCEILIHQEPAGLIDARLDHRIAARAGGSSARRAPTLGEPP